MFGSLIGELLPQLTQVIVNPIDRNGVVFAFLRKFRRVQWFTENTAEFTRVWPALVFNRHQWLYPPCAEFRTRAVLLLFIVAVRMVA